MAFTEERSITCPACGYERMEKVWMALDTITFPFKKWELLNRSMFRHKCLHCGHEFDMDHDFRYHQPESRELIWYVRSDEEEKEALDVLANGKRSGAWDEEERRMFDAVTDDYILRVVRSQKALIEKIMLFDRRRDDRIMEIVKILLINQTMQADPDLTMTGIYYNDDGDREGFVLVDQEKTIGTIPMQEALYEKIEKTFAPSLSPLQARGNYKVDFAWARSFLAGLDG